MATISSILDSLLPQVLGRQGDVQRSGARLLHGPLSGVLAIKPAAPGSRQNDPHLNAAGHQSRVDETGAARLKAETPAGVRDGAPPRSSPAPGETAESASTQANLSRAARTIASLLAAGDSATTAASTSRAALLPSSQPPPATTLAALLGQQVAQSGVFYEAHLLQWLQGKRAHGQLLKEPQANTPTRAAGEADSAAGTRAAARPGPAAPSGSARMPALVNGGPGASPEAGASGPGPGTAGPAGHAMVDDRLVPIVRHQFEVLANAAFQWRGEVWPGTPMQWRIEEHGESPERGADANPQQRRYTTSLALELPALGRLEVRLTLIDNGVRVHARAHRHAGAAALAADRQTLRERLARAGFEHAAVEPIERAAP